jgi:hypothetical protein
MLHELYLHIVKDWKSDVENLSGGRGAFGQTLQSHP